jgi:hypothetical protein
MSWVRFHPFTRITIVLALLLGTALLTGVERVGEALANIAPGGSFAERCESLPASRVLVSLQAFDVSENRTHRTIGLTRANFGHRSSIEVKGLEDRAGLRACARPQVHVELFLRPLVVYVAREYTGDPCRASVIREHEQRHVDVYASYARESVERLSASLHRALGNGPQFATTVGEAQQQLDRRIADALEAFMRESERTLAQRQAAVDTPEEYARVSGACLAQQ